MNVERLTGSAQLLLADIEAELAKTHGLRSDSQISRRDFLAAQQGANSGHQFARQKRLGEIVVRTGFEADHFVERVALCGEHQNGQCLAFGAQTAAYFQTILFADHQIQHEQIVRLALQITVEPFAVLHNAYLKTVAGEKALQHVAKFGFVVEYDDFRGPFHARLLKRAVALRRAMAGGTSRV